MDIHHEIMYQVMEEKLYLAPLTKRDRVLDVGTGTGTSSPHLTSSI